MFILLTMQRQNIIVVIFPSSLTLPFSFSKLVSDISFAAEISEKLLHQGISGTLPPATSKQCGCGAAS